MRKLPAPHIHKDLGISMIYPHVLVALLPTAIAGVYYYGIRALLLVLCGMASCAVFDFLFVRYIRKEKYVWEASSLVSGAILALLFPPTVPVWILIFGAFFSTILVKQCFGGLGSNLFNPAFAARAFLSLAFPTLTAVYTEPTASRWEVLSLLFGPQQTETVANSGGAGAGVLELLSGRFAGEIGTTCVFALLIGAVYLFSIGILRPQAPLFYFGVLCILFLLFPGAQGLSLGYLIRSLAVGGVLFAGVFALNDYSTTPTTPLGRSVFGVGAGLLTFLLCRITTIAVSVSFAILVMNAVTPILDFYIRPRIFGSPSWFRTPKEGQKLKEAAK